MAGCHTLYRMTDRSGRESHTIQNDGPEEDGRVSHTIQNDGLLEVGRVSHTIQNDGPEWQGITHYTE